MQNPLKLFALVLAMGTATSVCAYQVEGGLEKGFYVVDIHSSAPLRVVDGLGGYEQLTPQEYLDRHCPDAKVLEINMAGVPRNGRLSTSVQIVFEMPARGCNKRGD